MNKFRKVNNKDILKDWYENREENYLYYISPDEDFSNDLKIDIYRKKILKNVNKQKRKYIKKQMDYMYENIMNYSDYVTEKYYRNGFCDAFELFLGLLQ